MYAIAKKNNMKIGLSNPNNVNNSFPKSRMESIPPSIKRKTRTFAIVNFLNFRRRKIPNNNIREISDIKKRLIIVEELKEF